MTHPGPPLGVRSLRAVRVAMVAARCLFAGAVSSTGCQVIAGYREFEPEPPHPCDPLEAEKMDSQGATMVLTKQPGGSCYYIDKTEVTVAQYAAFVSHARGSNVVWGDRCGWKSSPSDPAEEDANHKCTIEAMGEADAFRATKPIRCVDWCDARAFCRHVGKSLCGGLTTGGVVEPTDVPDQWGNACSESGLPLPYGDGTTPESRVCNVGLSDGECLELARQYRCAPVEVGTFPECRGPHGALDMLGNVAEWVLNCGSTSEDKPEAQLCRYRGGSFGDSLKETTCYTQSIAARNERLPKLGFRCCAELTPEERTVVVTRP